MSAAAATLPLAVLFGLPEACRYAPTLVVPVVVQSELSVTVAIRHIAIPSPCSVLAIVPYSRTVAQLCQSHGSSGLFRASQLRSVNQRRRLQR